MPRIPCFLLLAILSGSPLPASAQTHLKVMTFNTWGAGINSGDSIDSTVAVIQAANPDIIGLQEIRGESMNCLAEDCPPASDSLAPMLAAALGYEFREQTGENDALWANAILSRYPIRALTENKLGARIDVNGRDVLLFNIHTTDYPYGPYQLLSIPYGDAPFADTAEQAVDSAWKARGAAFGLLQADLLTAGEADLILITGDFNEPSARDWTANSVAAGLHPAEVAWPFTLAIEQLGFTDVFRAAHPDPLRKPGFTWSPTITDESTGDHRDRIDYIFARGPHLKIDSARVIGEPGPWSDLVVDPFPSDHRAVVAEISF